MLISLGTLLTVQMAALTAYLDVFAGPGGLKARRYDDLGRPFTGLHQVWSQYGPLLWGVYALALLVGLALMWRTILTHPPRAGWGWVPTLIALCAVFWALNLDRFYFQ